MYFHVQEGHGDGYMLKFLSTSCENEVVLGTVEQDKQQFSVIFFIVMILRVLSYLQPKFYNLNTFKCNLI